MQCSLLTLGFLFLSTHGFAQTDFFESKVRPLLASRCQKCHGGKTPAAGLDFSTGAGSRAAGETILKAIGYQERVKMPPAGKLPDAEIAVLREWVKSGSAWPSTPIAASQGKQYTRAQKEFWSFQPLRAGSPPAVKNESWVRNPIDRFLLARMEANGLAPAPEAGRLEWIRRATYDLTGLPPGEQEIRPFLGDGSLEAYAKVVDRLLASPRYGERWGRHWLDVARYADSTGADEDIRYPHAWRYRDYVIDAFNRDLPYDQFIREQIAGDLLPDVSGGEVNVRGIVATGFLALGPKLVAEQDKVKMFYDIVDEQIDVTGKAFLGLTLACARCHDHKFDPIPTKDYYSLASIFASTKQLSKLEGTVSQLYYAPLAPRAISSKWEAHQKKVAEVKREMAEVTAEEGRRYRDALAPKLGEYMIAARRVYEEGADAEAVRREGALHADVLSRWVEYLKPSKERRAHLEPWYQAKREELSGVAGRYETEFLGVVGEREKARAEWKAKAAAAKARGEEPPEAPKFQPGDHRFFTEVTTAKGPFALPDKNAERYYSQAGREALAAHKAELQRLMDAAPPEPPFACGVAEGKNVEQHVFVRGNPESPGDLVTKRFPAILAGQDQTPITQGSGRKELAEWLSRGSVPLVARVMVNRIWQGHFGEGLVRTPSNFGLTGERPTHPELLDWLASEFMARGWSVKAMHRLMMLSNAYRMSGEPANAASLEKDPGNLLLSRFPMRRLTVEEIRDSLLALDDSLDLTMGGVMQSGEGTDKEFSDARKSLSPDESRRRTVYLPLRRSNLPSLLTLYDFGDATTSNEARAQTNVAPQALYMMNSTFVEGRAQALARKLAASIPGDEQRVERAYFLALGRNAEAGEVAAALEYLRGFPAKGGEEGAWASFCQALLASNDFIYVH